MMRSSIFLHNQEMCISSMDFSEHGYYTITAGVQYGPDVTLFLNESQLLEMADFMLNMLSQTKKSRSKRSG